jgi:site-specific recombinase XerD
VIRSLFPTLSIDLFASKTNRKLEKYVSRYPDPSACAVDAFSLTWNNEFGYIFHFDCSNLANAELVAQLTASHLRRLLSAAKGETNTITDPQAGIQPSTTKNESRTFSIIRKCLKNKGVPKQARNIIIKSWRDSTQKQYNTYINKWIIFCKQNINPLQPNINNILDFLCKLFNSGLKYRSIGVAKSALSVFLKICSNIDLTSVEEISRFMKGVFNERPALPRYNTTWDVNIVLNHLKTVQNTTLLQLSCKFCMLFLLLTAQRCQNLHLIELSDVNIISDKVTIYPNHLLKQSKPGHHAQVIQLKAFRSVPALCIVETLKEYLRRTEVLRSGQKLLVSTMKPHKAVSKSTISRWIRMVMLKAGVGHEFAPHSVRSASTSKAKLKGVPLEVIVKTAGWSNAGVFRRFYDKPIESQLSFQDNILPDLQ